MLSRHENTPEQVAAASLGDCLAWLEWNDRNGSFGTLEYDGGWYAYEHGQTKGFPTRGEALDWLECEPLDLDSARALVARVMVENAVLGDAWHGWKQEG